MNLIACDKLCIHQQEGYCTLEGPSAVVSSREGCAFFQDSALLPSPLPEETQRL